MPDTLTSTVIQNTLSQMVVVFNYQSDGTGVTDAIVVDKSTLTGPLVGTVPGRLVIEKIEYTCDGVQLIFEFDHTTDDLIATLAGQGFIDFARDQRFQGFVDPASPGGTGNIIVTSFGHTLGDRATVTLYLRKKQ